MAKCENCVHARVTTGRTVIMKNGMLVIQQTTPGGQNITCGAGTIQRISFIDDKMYCSSFRERESSGEADTGPAGGGGA